MANKPFKNFYLLSTATQKEAIKRVAFLYVEQVQHERNEKGFKHLFKAKEAEFEKKMLREGEVFDATSLDFPMRHVANMQDIHCDYASFKGVLDTIKFQKPNFLNKPIEEAIAKINSSYGVGVVARLSEPEINALVASVIDWHRRYPNRRVEEYILQMSARHLIKFGTLQTLVNEALGGYIYIKNSRKLNNDQIKAVIIDYHTNNLTRIELQRKYHQNKTTLDHMLQANQPKYYFIHVDLLKGYVMDSNSALYNSVTKTLEEAKQSEKMSTYFEELEADK